MSIDDRDLSRIAEAVADGRAVDWVREKQNRPDLTSSLDGLLTVESIVGFQRPVLPAESETISDPCPSPEEATDEAIPESWGNLSVLGVLGKGSFADVYRAHDSALRRDVALKLPHTEDELHSRSFLREARRLARIHHENVVQVHGAEEYDGRVGMWMDVIEGRDLEAHLEEQGPFSAGEAALIGVDLCRALAAVHKAGLVHRDIKAANVMREEGGRIVLMDFSSVVRRPPIGAVAEEDSSTYGTPFYMAPETLEGAAASRASDVYSLGVLLYRLVSGSYPVEGADSLAELREKHRRGEAVPLLDVRPDLPAQFAQIVEKALTPDPAERYVTVGEMEKALRAAIASAPSNGEQKDRPPAMGRRLAAAGLILGALAVLAAAFGPGLLGIGDFEIEAALFRRGERVDERLTPGATLALGQELFLEVEASRPFHAYILNEDAAGRQIVLYPVPELALTNPLPAGVTHRLPGPAAMPGSQEDAEQQTYWRVSSTGGEETLLLIASLRQLPDLETQLRGLPRVGSDEAAAQDLELSKLGRQAQGGVAEPTVRGLGDLTWDAAVDPSADDPGVSEMARRLLTSRSDEIQIWEIRLRNPPEDRGETSDSAESRPGTGRRNRGPGRDE